MSLKNGFVRGSCAVIVVLCLCTASRAAQLQVPTGYPTIQAAIDASVAGDEIVLQPGTYTGPGNRDLNFRSKAVLLRSTNPLDPATVAATVLDCQASASDLHRAVTLNCSSAAHDAGLAGLSITGAADSQGAVVCEVSSSPEVRNCFIHANSASGIYCRSASAPRIRDCRIEANITAVNGGGIFINRDATPLIQRCRIRGNNAVLGGGIYCYQAWPDIQDSEITGSYAESGGGLYWQDSGVSLTNCTVAGNSAHSGGIYALSIIYKDRSSLDNCIVWGNQAGDANQITLAVSPQLQATDTLVVAYSLIQGGQQGIPDPTGWALTWAEGNLAGNADPRFASAGGSDGKWDTWQDNDYHLAAASPCADAGDPSITYTGLTDADGHPRLAGSGVDLGAYEAVPLALNRLTGDCDADGSVDVVDLLILVNAFGASRGQQAYNPACDFDANGQIDVADLLVMVQNFGNH